jgi:hypothetical protein
LHEAVRVFTAPLAPVFALPGAGVWACAAVLVIAASIIASTATVMASRLE